MYLMKETLKKIRVKNAGLLRTSTFQLQCSSSKKMRTSALFLVLLLLMDARFSNSSIPRELEALNAAPEEEMRQGPFLTQSLKDLDEIYEDWGQMHIPNTSQDPEGADTSTFDPTKVFNYLTREAYQNVPGLL